MAHFKVRGDSTQGFPSQRSVTPALHFEPRRFAEELFACELVFEHLCGFTECAKREKREGATFNPFISKAGKKKCFLISNRTAGPFQVPLPEAPLPRAAQKGPRVSFLPATEGPSTSELGSPEEPLVHPDSRVGGGDCPWVTVWHAMFKPELNREMFTILFIQATFWLFSV